MQSEIKLCNDFIAEYDPCGCCYILDLEWNDITVYLSSFINDESGYRKKLEGVKRGFRKFWNEKYELLEMFSNDIREVLIPYIQKNTLQYPALSTLSVEKFDNEYDLSCVIIEADDSGVFEMQFYFVDNNNPIDSLIGVSRNFGTDLQQYYVDRNGRTLAVAID